MSEEEYRAATKLLNLHISPGTRSAYRRCIQIYPLISGFLLILCCAQFVIWWKEGTKSGDPVPALVFFTIACLWYLTNPLRFRRRVKRLYFLSEANHESTTILSESGIRSVRPGKYDSLMEWGYYHRFLETADMFLIFPEKLPAFAKIPKNQLQPEQVAELRVLLATHLQEVRP
jgi:YcxB-like protein